MRIFPLLFILFYFTGKPCYPQFRPTDGQKLNYTQIVFEIPVENNADYYHFLVFADTTKPAIIDTISEGNSIILDCFAFGNSYFWKAAPLVKGEKEVFSSIKTFSIRKSPLINKENYRLRLIQPATNKDTSSLVLIDYNRIAINKNGTSVWFMPDIKAKVNDFERIRDLRLTDQGTFTFLNNKSAIECDINGNILWEAPQLSNKTKADSIGFYHHCFKKLKNGHYMVLGNKYIYKALPDNFSKPLANHNVVKVIGNTRYVRVEFGIIYEFDTTGQVVWTWESNEYFEDEELFTHDNADTIQSFGPHMNSFDIDEERGIISAGFRDISKIIIIEKSTKKILNSFGSKARFKNISTDLNFIYQHDSRFMNNGELAILNNNSVIEDSSAVSSVIIFDPLKKNKVKTSLLFKCNFDSLSGGRSLKGGGICPAVNGNYVVSMGHLNRLFEITPSGKIVWDGFYERTNKVGKWEAFPQYRVFACPGLYPILFSLKFKMNANESRVDIFNSGFLSDSYNVILKDNTGKILRSYTSSKVASAGKASIKIKKIPKSCTTIEIRSINNPLTSKEIKLYN